MEGSLALDGIATSAPYNYSALDPKSMEERGVEQFRRKPKFQYVVREKECFWRELFQRQTYTALARDTSPG